MIKNPASLWQRLLPLVLVAFSFSPAVSNANSTILAPKDQGYIADISGDGFYTWNKNRFPLKVYMQSGSGLPGYRSSYPEVLKQCFDDWSRVSDGKLSWKPVNNPKAADIIVTWSDQAVEAARGTEAGNTKTFARYNTETNWGKIDRAEMRLLTRLPEREFSDAEIHKAYLHEVGHAFGIAGHSNDRKDIMYFAVSKDQPGELSDRDKATINFLYQPDAQEQTTMIGLGPKYQVVGSKPGEPSASKRL
jgi:hypothetical protein